MAQYAMRRTPLDAKWDELMTLCENEAEFKRDAKHPKLLKLLGHQIERLASALGFGADQIQRREFRAVKDGGHVVRFVMLPAQSEDPEHGDSR